MAGFKVVLRHYTGQDDVVVGTDVSNRNYIEIEPLIGFFVNQLVLRTDLSGSPTFREVLGRVRRAALGAYTHQDLPFDKLVESLSPARDRSRTPLFQVKLVLQTASLRKARLPGLTISPLQVEALTAKFDWLFNLWESDGRLEGSLEYNTDLYDESTICRVLGDFKAVLESVAADPDIDLDALSQTITHASKQQLILAARELKASSISKYKQARRKAIVGVPADLPLEADRS
jgi:non-ribosomal peptide synthetase component F